MKNTIDNVCGELHYADSSKCCMMNCRHDELLLCYNNWILATYYDYQLYTWVRIHLFTYWEDELSRGLEGFQASRLHIEIFMWFRNLNSDSDKAFQIIARLKNFGERLLLPFWDEIWCQVDSMNFR